MSVCVCEYLCDHFTPLRRQLVLQRWQEGSEQSHERRDCDCCVETVYTALVYAVEQVDCLGPL
jgi:hypothetical protein